MNGPNAVLVGLACVFIIVAAALVISDHVTCFNFLGLTKGCVTH